MPLPPKTTISLPALANLIDHSLLHPTLTDPDLASGLLLAKTHRVAAACIKPYAIPQALQILGGSSVKICAVIGFPHGSSSTKVKVIEAQEAVAEGAQEVDMVVNVGKVLGGDWEYVTAEIAAVNYVVTQGGAILKVIFENDYLGEGEIGRLCRVCTEVGVAFVKTSTGYGFVKDPGGSGMYGYKGATFAHLRLMRKECGEGVQIKAAGGVRTLDDLIKVKALGVTRVGATATAAMLEEARSRGIGDEEMEVDIEWGDDNEKDSGAY